jgi:hypothetical protein
MKNSDERSDMQGICGTCAQPTEATSANEGYSDCCNDRIEYGDEAAQTVKQSKCQHIHTTPETDSFDGSVWVICNDCGAESLKDAS